MKTKLHNTLFVCALALMGLQEVQAQYSGVAYNGITPQLGVTVGVPVKIELENYDALSGAPSGDGANFGVNTDFNSLPSGATYYDSSAIAYGTQSVRLSSQFDIEAGGTGHVLTNLAPGESVVFTVNVVTAGTYHLNVHYKNNLDNKSFKILRYNAVGTGKTLIYDSGVLPLSTEYVTTNDSGPIQFAAGTWLIRFRIVQGGSAASLNYDYMTFTLDTALSTDEAKLKANTLKAYPNPASNGQFNLNINSEWNVYSLLGVKVLEGKGKMVDLSSFAKGIYILKTASESKLLISK